MEENTIQIWIAVIALVFSVISGCYSFYNFRYNRKLAIAQRFNYAMDKYMMVKTRQIEVKKIVDELKLKHGSVLFDKDIEDDLEIIFSLNEDVRKDIEEISAPEKLDSLIVEKIVTQLNHINMIVQDIEKDVYKLKTNLSLIDNNKQ